MDSIVATFLDVEAMTYVSASETAKYEQLFFGYIQRCEGEVSWRRYTLWLTLTVIWITTPL